jgi:predicted 2-oxoglutarate/Fe(II)-dependent dioxygenase YbiX
MIIKTIDDFDPVLVEKMHLFANKMGVSIDAMVRVEQMFEVIGKSEENFFYEEDFMSEEDISLVLDYLSKRSWVQLDDHQSEVVPDDKVVLESPEAYNVMKKYEEKAYNFISKYYKDKFNLDVRRDTELSPRINRLNNLSNNLDHTDYDYSENSGSPFYHVTALMYFNDEYDGGVITCVEIDKSIKPKAGSFITFPSNYLHRVSDVVVGPRYAMLMIFNIIHS